MLQTLNETRLEYSMSVRFWIAAVLLGIGILDPSLGAAQVQAITDGSFEAGGAAWSPSGTVISSGCCPRTGTRYAVMGDVNNSFDVMWQQFTIPSNATYCELSFWRSITSSETSTTSANDVLNVTLQNSSGQYLATVAVRSNLHKQASAYPYVQEFLNLTAYKGQTLRLHFFATTNATLPTTFRIDDVSVIYTLPVQRSLSVSGQNTGGTIYLTSVPTDIFGNVTLPAPNTFTYNDGQSVYLIASQTAPNGNHFWKWILDGVDIGYSYTSPSFTMNSNRSIVAAFQLPPPPTLVGPGSPSSPGPQLSTLTPTFSWNSVAGASRYGLYISKYPFNGPLVYQNDNVTGTALALPANYLINGAQYRWDMGTYNSAGQLGTISAEFYFQTPPAQRTLSVAAEAFGTSAPIPGVFISAIPADVNGKNLDDTPFDLLYNDGQSVQLIAAATAPNGYEFLAWLLDGNEIGYSLMSEPISMNANHTAIAVYSPPVVRTLVVTSSPDLGAMVTADHTGVDGRNSGNTTFELYYEDNAPLCLTAASSHNGKDFVKWQLDGVDSPDGCVVMNADHTLTAVYEAPVNPPAAPFLEEVTDAGTGSDIVVRWSHVNPTQVSFYRVEWGLSPGDLSEGSKDVNSGPGTDYRTTIPGLVEHTPYYISIRAFDAATSLWSATAMWLDPVRPTVPVVLIHGSFRGSPETWDHPESDEDFPGWLHAAGYNRVWIPAIDPCAPDLERHFSLNAWTLGQYIRGKLEQLTAEAGINVGRVDMIAHSMGGLVARRVATRPWHFGLSINAVRNLVMLGTPNGGHPAASVFGCDLGICPPAWCEMSIENIAGQDGFNELAPNNPNTVYTVIGGDLYGRVEPLLVTTQAYAWEPLPPPPADPYRANDLVVSVVAAFALDPFTLAPTMTWDHQYVRSISHFGFPKSQSLLNDIIIPVLRNNAPASDPWPPTLARASGGSTPVPMPQLARVVTNSIPTGEWNEDTIRIESAVNAHIVVVTNEMVCGLETILRSPTGELIDSNSALADPARVFFLTEGPLTQVRILNPEPGLWGVRNRLDTCNGATTGTYGILLGVSGTYELKLHIEPEAPTPDSQVLLTAEIQGVPSLFDTHVLCSFWPTTSSPSGSQLLHDDGQDGDSTAGDGVYSTMLAAIGDSGLYNFRVSVDGIDPLGDSISRVAVIQKQIGYSTGFCECLCHADPRCDSVSDIFDVVLAVDVAFRDAGSITDPSVLCPMFSTDVDCSGYTDIFDVIHIINVAFRGSTQAAEFCSACSNTAQKGQRQVAPEKEGHQLNR